MEEERVINLKAGGSAHNIREGHEVLKEDSVLMKWNTFGGESSAPSKSYMPMTSSDDTKQGNPAIAPKIAVEEKSENEDVMKKLSDDKNSESESESESVSESDSESDSESVDEAEVKHATDTDKKSDDTKKATQKIFKSDQELAEDGAETGNDKDSDSDSGEDDVVESSSDVNEKDVDTSGVKKDEVKNLNKKDGDDDQAGGSMRVKELTSLDLSDNVLFATLTNIFVSTKNENNIADIMENIAFDMREMRLMMAVEHKARRK
jgi:hypothetical protein